MNNENKDTRTEITWDNLQEGDVVINEHGHERLVYGKFGNLIFLSLYDNFRICCHLNYSKDELIDIGYTIKQPSQPIPDEVQKAIEHLQANGYKVTKE
jgi:hypothetical protein